MRQSPKEQEFRIAVRLTPKANCDAIDGFEESPDGEVIRARVRAIPEKGKANAALIKLISKWLNIKKSDIELTSGSKSRHKILIISGNINDLNERLSDLRENKNS